MNGLYDLCRVHTATVGTGTITLGAASTGYLTFAQAGVPDGAIVSYGIADGGQSETGAGTYNAGAGTLTRSVYRSTAAGNNTAITLSGNAQVFITALSVDFGTITIAPTPPANPNVGSLWWDSADGVGQLYIYFDDGNSRQWVVANSAAAGPNWQVGPGLTLNTGTTPATIAMLSPTPASIPQAGVTDGSNAAAGQVGEYLETAVSTPVTLTSTQNRDLGTLVVPAGDWEVAGYVNISASAAVVTQFYAWVSTVSATAPSGVGNGTGALSFCSVASPAGSSGWAGPTGLRRNNLTATTTFYLGAAVISGAATVTATGTIWARRMR